MQESKVHKPGYKHTPIGWVPKEWGVELLDTLAKRGSGHTPDKSFDEYYNGGVKWISLADSFRLDDGLIKETQIEVSLEGIKNSSAVIHPAGTVLLSRDAGVGKSAVMAYDMAVSQHFITWTCGSKLYNWYLYYWLQYKKGFFERQAVGSTIKTIGLPLFKRLTIPHPRTSEQKRIAHILLTWDEAIQKTQQLIAQIKQRNKGLSHNLLSGKKRMNGFTGKWKKVRIGDIIEESRIPSMHNDVAKRITVKLNLRGLGNRDVKGSEIDGATAYFTRKAGQFIYGKQNLHKGAFGIIPLHLDGFDSSQDIPAFDFIGTTNPKYFLYYMSQESWYEALENISTGTGSKRIHPDKLYKLSFDIPIAEEQNAIVALLETGSKELKLYEQQLANLHQQKKGLMQKLLSGEVRVKI